MLDSVAEEVGRERVDRSMVDDNVGPLTTKVVCSAISAEPKLKVWSG